MKRISNTIRIAYWSFMNPTVIATSNFKMLSDLLGLILKVGSEKRHMMTRLAFIHPDDGTENEIVSIWAGAGIASDPLKRNAELIEENQILKTRLKEFAVCDISRVSDNEVAFCKCGLFKTGDPSLMCQRCDCDTHLRAE